jgi:hypothetical protein
VRCGKSRRAARTVRRGARQGAEQRHHSTISPDRWIYFLADYSKVVVMVLLAKLIA